MAKKKQPKPQYVIKWPLDPVSYFKQMTKIGPAFGATLDDARKFDSEREAGEAYARFRAGAVVAEICLESDERTAQERGL
ncbi:MAG TPA: hypothetical protein VFQ42_22080 [Mycobacterium sp.]|nr:hypothetical protein [Mycobacterium sp.]